ncbi:MAG TPA: metalloregulator ArsR/SmtB family transcription factor [Candidatus Dormibacteraeota bacterium]|nr:metalloregulator ArsR/SmtB family transcription factor [Candidatus Dormibacteraeota bacterium]
MALKPLPVLRERGTCCALPDVDQDWADRTSALMKALGDPTRLTMVAALWKAQQPVCICDFTADLELSQSTISHHMARLKEAELVEARRQGIWMYYTLRKDLPAPTQKLLRQLLG